MQDETLSQGAESQDQARASSRPDTPELKGYQLGRKLGAGTFGEVWTGTQKSTGQAVAIKFLSDASLNRLHYFRRELERLRDASDHPGVVGLLDADLEHAAPYFVMPLLSRSLAQETAPFSAATCESWLRQLAEALRHSHDRGMLHCDLKPSNVMLDEAGLLRLVDFGQSCQQGEGVVSWGTLGYMAPEQARLGTEEALSSPSQRWDVYGLGATFYRLLTGRCPYWSDQQLIELQSLPLAEALQQYRQAILQRRLQPISEFDPDLADIVQACLRPDPQQRTQSMAEVLEDLQRRRQGQPLLCRRPWSWSYRLGKLARRPTVVVATLAGLVMLSGAAYAYQQQRELVTDLVEQRAAYVQAERPEEASLLWAAALSRRPHDPVLRTRLGQPRFALQDQFDRRASVIPIPGGPDLAVVWDNHLERSTPRGRQALPRLAADQTVNFSADGKHMEVLEPQQLRLLDPSDGRQIRSWKLPAEVLQYVLNPLTELTVLTPQRVIRYDQQGQILREWAVPAGQEPQLSPDGCWLRCHQGDTAVLTPLGPGSPRKIATRQLRFSPTSQWVLGDDKALSLVGKPDWKLGEGRFGCWVGDDRVAMVQGSRLEVDDTSGQAFAILQHRSPVVSAQASPDGKYLLSLTSENRLCLWDIQREMLLTSKPLFRRYGATFGFSADGTRFYGEGENQLSIWNLDPWRPNWTNQLPEARLAAGPKHDWIWASTDQQWRSLGLDGKVLAQGAWSSPLRSFSLSATGQLAVDLDGEIIRCAGLPERLSQEKLIHYQGSPEPQRLAFSPDGKWLAAALPDQLLLWKTGQKEPLKVALDQEPMALAFHPQGTEVAILTAKQVLVYGLKDGLLASRGAIATQGGVSQLGYSQGTLVARSGRTLWTPSRQLELEEMDDRAVVAWSQDVLLVPTRDGVQRYQLPALVPFGSALPLQGAPCLLQFDSSGQFCLIGGSDGTQIWDRQGLAPLLHAPPLQNAASALFAPGLLVISGQEGVCDFSQSPTDQSAADVNARWQAATGSRLEQLRLLQPYRSK